jgi:DNA-binding PadR family transcriptional regulator
MALILGYYDKQNLGDEQYKLTIPIFLNNCGFKGQILFRDPNDFPLPIPDNIQIIICGGGDIINDWFNEKLIERLKDFKGLIIGLSIGITYESTINKKYLGLYDYIFLRHSDLLEKVSNVIGPSNVKHIPDLSFLLTPETPIVYKRKTIGIFTANGCDMEKYISESLKKLSKDYDIILFNMNTSTESHEGDSFSNNLIGNFNTYSPNNVKDILYKIGGLHMAICLRYHSHIFSIIQGIPFVSIAVKPKTKFLMENFGFKNNIAYSGKDLQKAIDWSLNNHTELKLKTSQVYENYNKLIKNVKIPLELKTRNIYQITDKCNELLKNNVSHEEIAKYGLLNIVGSEVNDYYYGFVNNLNKGNFKMQEMLEWVDEDYNKTKKPYKGLRFLQSPNTFSGVHRGGWESVCRILKALENPKGILCDLYVDSTFHWKADELVKKGILPYNQLWVGFIHHTNLTDYGSHNTEVMFNSELFLQSLKFCRGLIVLSENLKNWLTGKLNILGFKNIPVYSIKHPTEATSKNFELKKWLQNPTITQVGAFLRDTYAIYALKNNWARKQVLQGSKMESYIHPEKWYFCNTQKCKCNKKDDETTMCKFMTSWAYRYGSPRYLKVCSGQRCCEDSNQWSSELITKIKNIEDKFIKNYNSVKIINHLTNDEYDDLLTKTVVFINLLDCSAANTIIECIQRSTPIMLNKIPATIEYLGSEYPGFYENFNTDIDEMKNNYDITKILDSDKYLKNIDKTPFSLDQFLRNVENALKDYV